MSDQAGGFKLPFKVGPRLITLAIIIIIVAAGAVTSVFTVDETERAVVLRLGQYMDTKTAGLHFKLPFGIDRHYIVDTTVKSELFGFTRQTGVQSTSTINREESMMLTGDLNIIEVRYNVQYRVENPRDYLFNVEDPISTIRDISQGAMNKIVGDRSLLSLLERSENYGLIAKEEISATLNNLGMGLGIDSVNIEYIGAPEGEVRAAFEEVNKANQLLNQLINEGQAEYNREIPRARGEARQLIEQAQGYAAERVNNARGDVARYNEVYEAYESEPNTTRTRLYLETLREVLSNTENLQLIDKDLAGVLPLLNLNQGAN